MSEQGHETPLAAIRARVEHAASRIENLCISAPLAYKLGKGHCWACDDALAIRGLLALAARLQAEAAEARACEYPGYKREKALRCQAEADCAVKDEAIATLTIALDEAQRYAIRKPITSKDEAMTALLGGVPEPPTKAGQP